MAAPDKPRKRSVSLEWARLASNAWAAEECRAEIHPLQAKNSENTSFAIPTTCSEYPNKGPASLAPACEQAGSVD